MCARKKENNCISMNTRSHIIFYFNFFRAKDCNCFSIECKIWIFFFYFLAHCYFCHEVRTQWQMCFVELVTRLCYNRNWSREIRASTSVSSAKTNNIRVYFRWIHLFRHSLTAFTFLLSQTSEFEQEPSFFRDSPGSFFLLFFCFREMVEYWHKRGIRMCVCTEK